MKSKKMRKFKKYMRRTLKNKLMSLLLTAIAILSVILIKDATAAFIILFIAIPLFFVNENYVN